MTQPFDIEAMRRDMEAAREAPWVFVETISPCGQEWFGCGVSREGEDEFIWFDHRAEVDVPTARLIASCPAMAAEILRLTAENEQLQCALKDVIGVLDDPHGGEHVRDMRGAALIARAALGDAP